MWAYRTICVVWLALHLTRVSSREEHSSATVQDSSRLIRQAFRDLVNIKNIPESPAGRWGGKVPKPPPKYMMELYEKYRTGRMGGVNKGSTIRSILAMKGKIRGDSMLVFNLSGVDRNEKITKSELHFFRKKRRFRSAKSGRRSLRNANVRLTLYDINEEKLMELQQLSLAPKSYGWQSHNVTRSAIICRNANDSHNLLGLKFEMAKKSNVFRTVSPRRIVRNRMTPFLILFSESEDDDNLQAHTRLKRFVQENEVDKYATISRNLKASVYDNELPDSQIEERRHQAILSLHPKILRPRKKARIDSTIIPMPKKEKKKWRKKFNHRKRKKSSSDRSLPIAWQQLGRDDLQSTNPSGQCQKKSLSIDFSEIGWGQWVISPKSFQANYCSGSCPFPLKKGLRPSNHATIQSIVHAIGSRPDVPEPSCVPSAMSSLTLLYFDEDLNVVLKNYPGMIVERCACQ